jgi:hypothetical protein
VPAVLLDIATGKIPESFQALKELMHGLLAHPGALCTLVAISAMHATGNLLGRIGLPTE